MSWLRRAEPSRSRCVSVVRGVDPSTGCTAGPTRSLYGHHYRTGTESGGETLAGGSDRSHRLRRDRDHHSSCGGFIEFFYVSIGIGTVGEHHGLERDVVGQRLRSEWRRLREYQPPSSRRRDPVHTVGTAGAKWQPSLHRPERVDRHRRVLSLRKSPLHSDVRSGFNRHLDDSADLVRRRAQRNVHLARLPATVCDADYTHPGRGLGSLALGGHPLPVILFQGSHQLIPVLVRAADPLTPSRMLSCHPPFRER